MSDTTDPTVVRIHHGDPDSHAGRKVDRFSYGPTTSVQLPARPTTEPRPIVRYVCPHFDVNHALTLEESLRHRTECWAHGEPSPPAEAAPRAEGLDPELAAIYLAAAMKECGYTATEADARSILDYLDGDNGVRLAPQERRDNG